MDRTIHEIIKIASLRKAARRAKRPSMLTTFIYVF